MPEFDAGSFKDPDGRVFYHDERVFRTLSEEGRTRFEAAVASGLIAELIRDRAMVDSELVDAGSCGLDPAEFGERVLLQEKVPLVSYPYEWSFDMLRDAALLTLDVFERCLQRGFALKDATAFNILFFDNRPVLIDVPSIEPRREGEAWVGYAQFCRSFLFPLLLNSHLGIDFQLLLRAHLGELPLREVRALFRFGDWRRPGVFRDVVLQARLDASFSTRPHEVSKNVGKFQFQDEMILANLRRLRKVLGKLRYETGRSEWGEYTSFHNYQEQDERTKAELVGKLVQDTRPQRVLDLGCNTGTYSDIAAKYAGRVISLDIDPEAINTLYKRVGPDQSRDALIGNLANPSPALGWRTTERRSLADRVGSDFFLALALIHHLRITNNVPLASIVEHLAELAPEGVIEWVDRSDSMVERMLANREDVFGDYHWKSFVAAVEARFSLVSVTETHEGRRRLCHVRTRS